MKTRLKNVNKLCAGKGGKRRFSGTRHSETPIKRIEEFLRFEQQLRLDSNAEADLGMFSMFGGTGAHK